VSDIFREIDEELRRDNLLKLWARYGRFIIAAVIVVMALAAGFAAWRSHQLAERQAQSARFASALALAQAGKNSESAAVLSTINTGDGYAVLAAFENAALLAKQGEHKQAATAYDRIAASNSAGPTLRDLATLLSAMQSTVEIDPKGAIARLAPLTAPGGPWRPTALELTAAAQLKLGHAKAARDIYKGLADDPTAPHSLRARAAEMAAALSS
jgi:hypothetical protein